MRARAEIAAGETPWLPVQRRCGAGTGPGSVVICFPPAGAGAGFFRDWTDALPGQRLVAAQLPGREERFGERPVEDVRLMAAEIADAIRQEGWDAPFLLGYSFGSLLAFETALALEASGFPLSGVIAMARGAPQSAPQASVADLPDDAFIDYVRGLGGLPPEIDEMPELAELMMPIMRADFRANDGYARRPGTKLRCPLATIAGENDPATGGGRGTAWADCSERPHRLTRVAGGHFFVHENAELTFAAIADAMAQMRQTDGSER